MLNARFVLCADTVLHDKETNSMSAIQIIENITSAQLPLLIHRLSTLAVFERDPDDPQEDNVEFRLTLDKDEIVRQEMTIHFNGPGLVNRSTIRFFGLAIHKPGILKAAFFKNNNEIGRYEIKIDLQTEPKIISED